MLTVTLCSALDPPNTMSRLGSTEPTIRSRLSKVGSRNTNPIVTTAVAMNQKNTARGSEHEHAAAVGAVGNPVRSGCFVFDVVDLGRRQVEVAAFATMTCQLRHGDA